VNCFTSVRTRKSGVCFCSNKNDKEREASFSSGDEKRLVEEIPCTPALVDFVRTNVQIRFVFQDY
jgi:hypothetical protein